MCATFETDETHSLVWLKDLAGYKLAVYVQLYGSTTNADLCLGAVCQIAACCTNGRVLSLLTLKPTAASLRAFSLGRRGQPINGSYWRRAEVCFFFFFFLCLSFTVSCWKSQGSSPAWLCFCLLQSTSNVSNDATHPLTCILHSATRAVVPSLCLPLIQHRVRPTETGREHRRPHCSVALSPRQAATCPQTRIRRWKKKKNRTAAGTKKWDEHATARGLHFQPSGVWLIWRPPPTEPSSVCMEG